MVISGHWWECLYFTSSFLCQPPFPTAFHTFPSTRNCFEPSFFSPQPIRPRNPIPHLPVISAGTVSPLDFRFLPLDFPLFFLRTCLGPHLPYNWHILTLHSGCLAPSLNASQPSPGLPPPLPSSPTVGPSFTAQFTGGNEPLPGTPNRSHVGVPRQI